MMKEDAVIHVEHVSKDFVLPHEKVNSVKGVFTNLAKGKTRKVKETQHALKDVSFKIEKGEFFGIVGRNGSGKSTLLKILAGIYQPTSGSIAVNGKLVPFIELGVGFNPELSGRENVYLNGAMMGFSEKKINEMYDDIVNFAELERFMDQKLKNYSSGMQVRLAFSVAVKAEADILLIDEVLAVGDAAFQGKCFDYFRELKAGSTTVILVTHDMNAVRLYCDRAMLIENGKVLSHGSSSDVASDYSRIFIENEANGGHIGKDRSRRWGDSRMVIQKVEIPKKLLPNETLKLKIWGEAQQEIDSPIFGFVIKNAAKVMLLGTNTIECHQTFDKIKKGQKIYVEWEVPNVFSNGMHSIDIAIVYKGGSSVADWWEDAVNFSVQKEISSQYAVSPNIKLKAEQL
jgi:ABC-2 type transport system ATP-binding protein